MNKRLLNPSVRKRKAYWLTFVIVWSYFRLWFLSKILGQAYFEDNLKKLHLKNAERIKKTILELQGLFIKIGQLVSNLSNVLPDELRAPLEELQDNVPAKDFAEIEQSILTELGTKPNQLFQNFNQQPLAAASIGQVHTATYQGEKIAVKIQHANIPDIAKADLEIIRRLVKLLGRFLYVEGMDHLYEQVSLMIKDELDYGQEAKSMQRISDNLQDEVGVVIPKVFHELSSPKILTTKFCKGVNISNIEQLKAWGLDTNDIAKRLIHLFCKMILVDGFYHADPHPGNIYVNEQGEIILLDFGAVAELNPTMRKGIPELIEAILRNDSEATVDCMKKMGFVGSGNDAYKVAEHILEVVRNFIQNELQLDSLDFKDIHMNLQFDSLHNLWKEINIRELAKTLQIPKDWILLNRTLVLVMGISFELSPKMNPLEVLRPFMQSYIIGQDGGIMEIVTKTVKNQVATVLAIPIELQRFLKKANKGKLELEVGGLRKGFQLMYHLGQQFMLLLFCIASTYFAYLYQDVVDSNAHFWFSTGAVISLLLFLRSWFRASAIKL